MKALIYEFPDHKHYEIERPLGALPDSHLFALRINDDSFAGTLRRGQIVTIEEGELALPGFHAVRLCSGLLIVRFAFELSRERVRLVAANTDYPEFEESRSALVGRVLQMKNSDRPAEQWELINREALPRLIMEWLLYGLACDRKSRG